MPQTTISSSTDKWKEISADLGRPTLRGIRKCPKCGTINGTRGNSCKNKGCDVVFRDIGLKKKAVTETCKLIAPHHLSDCQIFSVRRRDRGPDYRNFVRIPTDASHEVSPTAIEIPISDCTTLNSDLADDSSSQKCFVEACNTRGRQFPCNHLQSVQKCFANSQVLPIKNSAVASLNLPMEFKNVISQHLNTETADQFVQRVSSTSFVVRCDVSPKFPLGFLHVMIFKPNKYESSDKRFSCACRPYNNHNNSNKIPAQNRDTELISSNGNSNYENKYCVHYYTCLCAFASNQSLASEFDYLLAPFTSDSREFSPSLLSQLHLVNLPSSNGRDIEILDPNQISVEIMRENMSLLDSITDDSSLTNVQGLEGVLVTNDCRIVDDGFSLDTNSALDDLSEAEQQVCQLFANSQNMQLQSAFTSPEAVNSLEVERNCDVSNSNQKTFPSKKRKEDQSKVVEDNESSTSNYEKPVLPRKNLLIRSTTSKRQQNYNSVPYIIGVSIATPPTTNSSSIPDAKLQSSEKKFPSLMFDQWLAGVNERINYLMNYKLSTKPDPLVYIIHQDFYECLKDRIINTGLKKRKLPNQTLLVPPNESSFKRPLTKHVWKITCLNHLLSIFNCDLVLLKPTQYFIKTGNDAYEEWIEPKDVEDANKVKNNLPSIAPILHSTTIKIGKPEYNSVQPKELTAFIIEYIPDFLPLSKMGELKLMFEIEHSMQPKPTS